MRIHGKPAHIGADLRRNDLSAQLADSRDCAQPLDGVTKAGKLCIDLPIKLGDANLKRVDLLHMQLKQEPMVDVHAELRAALPRGHVPSNAPA